MARLSVVAPGSPFSQRGTAQDACTQTPGARVAACSACGSRSLALDPRVPASSEELVGAAWRMPALHAAHATRHARRRTPCWPPLLSPRIPNRRLALYALCFPSSPEPRLVMHRMVMPRLPPLPPTPVPPTLLPTLLPLLLVQL